VAWSVFAAGGLVSDKDGFVSLFLHLDKSHTAKIQI